MAILITPLAWLLSMLYKLIGDYGISLIIFTIIVKLAIYPLYKKQTLSTAGMADIQPKMQALQKKYANDKEKLNEKLAELYKEEGYNPMGGCLPMIVQMGILMLLFGLLRQPMLYMHSDNMYFAVHESFLWIQDLSQPDLWILPLLAGVTTFFSFWMNQQQMGGSAAQGNVMSKVMSYFFPIMIVWMSRTFPSGVSLYWFVGQVIQILFNFRFNQIRKAMDVKKKSAGKQKK